MADETRVQIHEDLRIALEGWDVAENKAVLDRYPTETMREVIAARARVLEIYRSLEGTA